MPVVNGEKFACSSCIKGHRVSGCNHTDRPLHHINPKGRPVKQCEHCRGARKSKSHHAKCDCGDKKDKEKDKDKVDANVHDSRCACHSGSKCICGIKKEPLDLRLDTSRQTLHDARAKPKLTSTHSESTLTVFANGHHKPCHRNNNAAHVSGMPYKMPSRPHTLHGAAQFAAFAQASPFGHANAPAQRSMDTQSIANNDYHAIYGTSQYADDTSAGQITPATAGFDSMSFQDALFGSRSSTFGQGSHSPTESHLSDTTAATQWPWASSLSSTSRNFGYGSLSTSPSQDCLPNLENNDWSIPSAGLTNPTWSATDLPLNPNKLSDNLIQPISQSGESGQSGPGLTVASSSPSETGDAALFGDLEYRAPQSTVGESLFWEDSPVARLATSVTSDSRAPTSVPLDPLPENQDLELDYKSINSPSAITALDSTTTFGDGTAIAMPNSIEDVASNDPWLFEQNSMYPQFGNLDLSYTDWPFQ